MDKVKRDLLEIVYDHLAGNDVRVEDSLYLSEAIDHIDYDHEEIVFLNGDKEYMISISERKTDE